MRAIKVFTFIALSGVVMQQSLFARVTSVYAADNMAQVQLILKKMKESMKNMKDFDELEKAGMDKNDVDRMRNAMNVRIKQMTTSAVDLIRVL